MRKLFLAICFSLFLPAATYAKVTEVFDQSQLPQREAPGQKDIEVKPVSSDDLGEFLSERLERTFIQPKEQVPHQNMNTLPSDQALQAEAESQKGMFQKIYEQALKRLDQQDAAAQRQDIYQPQMQNDTARERREWEQPNFPVIRTALPSAGKTVTIPAREHIPYLMSNIELLPDGTVKFSETVMVVADGQKLRKGLTKILPKDIFSRNRELQKISYTLIGVSANGQNIPYKMIENGPNVLLIPEENYRLEPGVYTYQFDYLADNLLWDYGDFKELYWDVTGSAWNMVVARAGATLKLPAGGDPLGQELYAGNPRNLSADSVSIINPSPNVWGYAVNRPLFAGEGLHLIVSLPENITTPPSWDKRLLRRFERFGDIYISAVTLAAILLSFLLSWKYIRANKGQLKVSLQKTPAVIRYLVFNRYDYKSFGGFLLGLYRKNIIDIQQADDTILLIKRTDNLKSLSRGGQKAVACLFTHDEPVLNVNAHTLLKIKRAAREIEKDTRRILRRFLLKLNAGYLFFSFGMLFWGEAFIALSAVNSLQTFIILAASTLCLAAGIILCGQTAQRLWHKIALKIGGIALIIPAVLIMAAVVSLWSVLLIALALLTIRHFTTAYGQRNGLLKSHIEELGNLRNSLTKHHDNIVLGKEIANQQPTIWVLDMENDFADVPANEYNKLDTMKHLLRIING